MKKKLKKLLKANGGFTLLELIVVVAIMGFLVAMIAPRLAGAGEGASDVICDTNQTRLRQVTATWVERTASIPNNLTNLVTQAAAAPGDNLSVTVGTDRYAVDFDDTDRDNGKEDLSFEINDSLRPKLHVLNADEAAEIRAMGISHVFNLNLSQAADQDHVRTAALRPFMDRVPVAAGVPVLMVGAGHDGTVFGHNLAVNTVYRNPDMAYRIILGVGPDSELVTQGQIEVAGICPNAIRRQDHFTYGNYSIVLPRLQATIDRALPVASITVEALTGETKTIELNQAQQPWQFSTFCPEGDVVGTVDTMWEIQ